MVRNEKEGRDALREGNTSMGHARIENRFVDLTILSRCPPFGFSLERIGHPAMGRDGRANEGKLLASCLESNSNSGGGGGRGGDDGDTCEMLVVVMSMMALGRTCLIAIKLTSIFVRPQASLDLAREITVLYENPSNWKRTKVNGKSDRVEKRPWKRYLSIAETTKGDEVWFKEGLPLKGMGGRKIEQEEEHKPAHDSVKLAY
ncbi:hypothetical protein HZH66_002810 [Vespula vulgaris]|uniref:Uncharacterized protein n=1 Tax=Vespula vulgaris TaxID=7454 RepID=A0A834NI36_VESVU|nr:hypothetical protein HZH66_002810 [Vespula vulgaris]